MCTRVVSLECSGQGVKLTIHLHLALGLRMSGDRPLLPLQGFMACTETTLPLLNEGILDGQNLYHIESNK
jgi:hypothetical protein